VVTDAAKGQVTINGVAVQMPSAMAANGPVGLALRPEAVHLGRISAQDVVLAAKITGVQFMGSVIRVQAVSGDRALALDTFNRVDAPPPSVGALVDLSFNPRDLIVLQA
jgi:putative spermidine/putrescine transport system ATP-binding protein